MKIVFIGKTGHCGYVVGALQAMPNLKVVGISPGSPDEDVMPFTENPIIKTYSAQYFDDYRKMLDETKPDIAVIASFYGYHAQATIEAINRGIHVFCEKPLATELNDLERIESLITPEIKIGTMMNYRYDPSYFTAKTLVDSGAIGKVLIGYSQKSYKMGTRPEFYKKRETFGGLIPWVGIHAIDWFQYISGVDYSAVSAYHKNLNAPDYPGLEDVATCLFELSNGGSAVMSFDFARPASTTTHGDDRLRIAGTEGVIDISNDVGLRLINGDGEQIIKPQSPKLGLFADFVESINNPSHKCSNSTQDVIKTTRTVLLAREAADTGEKIIL